MAFKTFEAVREILNTLRISPLELEGGINTGSLIGRKRGSNYKKECGNHLTITLPFYKGEFVGFIDF